MNSSFFNGLQPGPKTTNMFDSLPKLRKSFSSGKLQDELDIYLASDPEEVSDVIKWWEDRRDRFPNLSRMALDYHAIPGMCLLFPFFKS
jgi:hypothetical protein